MNPNGPGAPGKPIGPATPGPPGVPGAPDDPGDPGKPGAPTHKPNKRDSDHKQYHALSNHGLSRLMHDELPGEPKKSPLRLLLILQQCMGIFVRNFTRLLSDQIYTLSPSFIEIFLELTKLHSFNHDNPHLRSLFPCLFV